MSTYHSDTAHISKSMLSTFGESRRAFHDQYILGNRKEPTEAMKLGTLLHTAVLEPERYEASYCIVPDKFATKKGKVSEAVQSLAWIKANAGDLMPVTQQMLDDVACMTEGVKQALGGVLESPLLKVEEAIYWQGSDEDDPADETDGKLKTDLRFRAKPDLMIEFPDVVYVWDLKSTDDASPRGFRYAVEDYEYALQQVHYTAGLEIVKRKPIEWRSFIAAQNNWPFCCGEYFIEKTDIETAKVLRRKRIEQLETCLVAEDFRESWEASANKPPIEIRGRMYLAKGINENQEV